MKFTWSYQEQNAEPKKYSEEWYAQENKRLKDLFYKETHIKPGTKITEEDIKKSIIEICVNANMNKSDLSVIKNLLKKL